MTVGRIISEKGAEVATVPPSASLADVAATLSERKIGAVVVVDADGSIKGIVSERDLVRAVAKHGGHCLEMTASDWMTAEVVTCTPEDTVNEVMQKMTAGRFRHLPVVVDGKLGGIVSIGDVVKRRIAEIESEATSLREYIATG